MDPNFGQATLARYFATQRGRDRDPLHLEREMVVYKPANGGSNRSWMTAMRRAAGAGFIRLGERISPNVASEPADGVLMS